MGSLRAGERLGWEHFIQPVLELVSSLCALVAVAEQVTTLQLSWASPTPRSGKLFSIKAVHLWLKPLRQICVATARNPQFLKLWRGFKETNSEEGWPASPGKLSRGSSRTDSCPVRSLCPAVSLLCLTSRSLSAVYVVEERRRDDTGESACLTACWTALCCCCLWDMLT